MTGLDVRPGDTVAIIAARARAVFQLGQTYFPISVAGETAASATAQGRLPLVFAGYGISAPSLKYDDYEGLDVRGKAVLVFTHKPQENDEKSPFDGRTFTQHASLMQKAMVARGRGARVLLLAIDPSHDADAGNYAGWLATRRRTTTASPCSASSARICSRRSGPASNLAAAARAIDSDLKPQSRPVAGVQVESVEEFGKVRRQIRNVIGVLAGADPSLAHEAVVIGAQYDHLGLGGRHSLAPDAAGQIHNGADDNASGTAALLEMARAIGLAASKPPRTVVFAAFAGEEVGLLDPPGTWIMPSSRSNRPSPWSTRHGRPAGGPHPRQRRGIGAQPRC